MHQKKLAGLSKGHRVIWILNDFDRWGSFKIIQIHPSQPAKGECTRVSNTPMSLKRKRGTKVLRGAEHRGRLHVLACFPLERLGATQFEGYVRYVLFSQTPYQKGI